MQLVRTAGPGCADGKRCRRIPNTQRLPHALGQLSLDDVVPGLAVVHSHFHENGSVGMLQDAHLELDVAHRVLASPLKPPPDKVVTDVRSDLTLELPSPTVHVRLRIARLVAEGAYRMPSSHPVDLSTSHRSRCCAVGRSWRLTQN